MQEICIFFLAQPQTYYVALVKEVSLLHFNITIPVYRPSIIIFFKEISVQQRYFLLGAYIFLAQSQLATIDANENLSTSQFCSSVQWCLDVTSSFISSLSLKQTSIKHTQPMATLLSSQTTEL